MSQNTIGTVPSTSLGLGHWFRMLIGLLSFGFIYPNSFTEGMDLTGIQDGNAGDMYKNKK